MNEELIIIAVADPDAIHFPATEENSSTRRRVNLDDVLRTRRVPSSWKALCGVRGGVFLRSSLFAHRIECPRCLSYRQGGSQIGARASEGSTA